MKKTDVVAALAALAQENRLDVFRLLIEAGHEGLPAGAVVTALDLAPNTLTFRFDRLRAVGLVTVRRDGRSMIYAALYETMNSLLGYLTDNCCGGARPPSNASPPARLLREVREVEHRLGACDTAVVIGSTGGFWLNEIPAACDQTTRWCPFTLPAGYLPCISRAIFHPVVLTKMKSSRSRGHGPKETTACSVIRRAISDGNLASSVTKNRLQMVCRRPSQIPVSAQGRPHAPDHPQWL
jgi:ArsR family transcriptional regulator